jgi:hypothetical protein
VETLLYLLSIAIPAFCISVVAASKIQSLAVAFAVCVVAPPMLLYVVFSLDPSGGGWAEVATFFGSLVAIPACLAGLLATKARKSATQSTSAPIRQKEQT